MKSFTLRMGAFALGAVLFNTQPVLAGCGELCMGSYCKSTPTQPSWGCEMSGSVCLDFKCWPARGTFDQELMAKIEKAALAGDTNTVALLAKAVGQPFRIHDKDGVVYDGFALAGLQGPGAGASSAETQVAQGACGTSATSPSSDTATPEATTAVASQER